MFKQFAMPVISALVVVLAIGLFAAGYAVGYYDMFEEHRVITGEIKEPHYIVPRLFP
jgi:hypothetical protein